MCSSRLGSAAQATSSARRGPHYNGRRSHRALQLRPPRPDAPVPEPIRGRVQRRPILAGLVGEYEAAA